MSALRLFFARLRWVLNRPDYSGMRADGYDQDAIAVARTCWIGEFPKGPITPKASDKRGSD